MSPHKKKVLVLYGGRSVEHDVSCHSAAFVLRHLDRQKYEVHAVAIDQDNRWLPQDLSGLDLTTITKVPIAEPKADLWSALTQGFAELSPFAFLKMACGLPGSAALGREDLVVFPVLHGTFGEDGTLQGLLDMAEVAYVGTAPLGSALAMDKVASKNLAEKAGLPVVPFLSIEADDWQERPASHLEEIINKLGLPVFVKPAALGSSVGISKAKDKPGLAKACEHAFTYDSKIIIEQAVNAREIECAILGGFRPEVSLPGEVIPHHEFYSYEAKYCDAAGATLKIPAELSPQQVKTVQKMAIVASAALNLYGMARIDFFLDKTSGQFYFNEVNTIPGFTAISQYPMLWQQGGLSPCELLDRLVALAVIRHDHHKSLNRYFVAGAQS